MPQEDGNARRRRDLEEILELRRSFGTLGRRLGTRRGPIRPGLVEVPKPVIDESYHAPDPPAPAGGQPFQIPDPPPARRRLPWPWLVGLAAVFAFGMAVDHTVLQPAPRPAPPASTPVQAPSAPSSSAAPAGPQVSVPQSCLVTAQRGDVLIDLLVKNVRGLELTKALKSYTDASQTCRKEASSR